MAIQEIPTANLIYAKNRLKELVFDCIRDPKNFRLFDNYEDDADKAFEYFVRKFASELNERIVGRVDKIEMTDEKVSCLRMALIYIVVKGI